MFRVVKKTDGRGFLHEGCYIISVGLMMVAFGSGSLNSVVLPSLLPNVIADSAVEAVTRHFVRINRLQY